MHVPICLNMCAGVDLSLFVYMCVCVCVQTTAVVPPWVPKIRLRVCEIINEIEKKKKHIILCYKITFSWLFSNL